MKTVLRILFMTAAIVFLQLMNVMTCIDLYEEYDMTALAIGIGAFVLAGIILLFNRGLYDRWWGVAARGVISLMKQVLLITITSLVDMTGVDCTLAASAVAM